MLAVIIRAEPPLTAAAVVGAAASFVLLLLSAVTTGGQLDPTGDAGRRPLPGVHGAVGAPLDGADAVRGQTPSPEETGRTASDLAGGTLATRAGLCAPVRSASCVR